MGRKPDPNFATSRTLLRLDDEAEDFLRRMGRKFPKEMRRAMRSLGYELRRWVSEAIQTSGASIGGEYPERSFATRSRRLTMIKSGKATRSGRWSRRKKLQVRRGSGNLESAVSTGRDLPPTPFGRVARAVRFHQTRSNSIHVGFLNSSSASFAKASREDSEAPSTAGRTEVDSGSPRQCGGCSGRRGYPWPPPPNIWSSRSGRLSPTCSPRSGPKCPGDWNCALPPTSRACPADGPRPT